MAPASVGYGMVVAIPEPRITNRITTIVIFLLLLWPIAIPIDRFREWSAVAHRILPFYHIANLIRSGLTEGLAGDVAQALAVVNAWAVLVGLWSARWSESGGSDAPPG